MQFNQGDGAATAAAPARVSLAPDSESRNPLVLFGKLLQDEETVRLQLKCLPLEEGTMHGNLQVILAALTRMRDSGADLDRRSRSGMSIMSEWNRHAERMADIFFNGRRADQFHAKEPKPGAVDWPELIRRGNSIVKFAGKRYHVIVKEVPFTATTEKP